MSGCKCWTSFCRINGVVATEAEAGMKVDCGITPIPVVNLLWPSMSFKNFLVLYRYWTTLYWICHVQFMLMQAHTVGCFSWTHMSGWILVLMRWGQSNCWSHCIDWNVVGPYMGSWYTDVRESQLQLGRPFAVLRYQFSIISRSIWVTVYIIDGLCVIPTWN